jgi:hypothetical protein
MRIGNLEKQCKYMEQVLCEKCGREFETNDELEFDELDPSGRKWVEKKEKVCPDCKDDDEENLEFIPNN